jgi:hypothetical protein
MRGGERKVFLVARRTLKEVKVVSNAITNPLHHAPSRDE